MRKSNKKDSHGLFRRNLAFTLTEILIVVVIIGVLATLALPMLVKSIEKAKVGEAITNLNLIRTGQKMYFLEYRQYSPDVDSLNIENPNDTSSRYFEYSIDEGGDLTADFTARAIRGGGDSTDAPEPYQDDNYIIQEDGAITGRFVSGSEPE